MATTDTGALGTLTMVSVTAVDANNVEVVFTLDRTSATEALSGFLIWHDDEAGSTTPVWVDAADVDTWSGLDSADQYRVIVPNPLARPETWWDTFSYDVGMQYSAMNSDEYIWNGAWQENTPGADDAWDCFSNYTAGTHASLTGGYGYTGGWA